MRERSFPTRKKRPVEGATRSIHGSYINWMTILMKTTMENVLKSAERNVKTVVLVRRPSRLEIYTLLMVLVKTVGRIKITISMRLLV